MALQPIPRKSIADNVFEQISGEILRGGYDAGATLPSERDLAVALKVNRGAIREALQRLEQAGLVHSRHGAGTQVLDFQRSAGLDLLPRLLFDEAGEINPAVVTGVFEMRSALAPDVARAAALRRSDEQHERLRALALAHAAAAGEAGALALQQELALEYWDVVVDAGNNIAYRLAFNSMRVVYDQVREAMVELLADEIADHARLIQIAAAIGDRDPRTAGEVARALCERGRRAIDQALADLAALGAAREEGADAGA